MRYWPVLLVVLLATLLLPAAPAFACSSDDNAWFDSFLDGSCLQTQTNTELDAFGGIRLTTNGVPTGHIWDTNTQFDSGIQYQSKTFGPLGARTLDTIPAAQPAGTDAALELPTVGLPLRRDAVNPIIAPAPSAQPDNDNVDDPAVVRDGSTYVMYYSATAEDGAGPVIMRATSGDGKTWSSRATVLTGTAASFDARGVFAPDVVVDVAATPKYRMWYSGKGDVFGAVGYATSADGITWTKYDPDANAQPDPVLPHGKAGSADSFSAQDPSVLLDGTTWKMWYTGDDSNRKRVAYATSADGITWSKGGKVIAPEDSVPANLAEGAFAPTVWKDGSAYNMVFTGRKFVSGTTYQTKLINASSSDGISWSTGSIALNPSGNNTKFDFSNLNAPEVLQDPSAASGERFKLYYSGDTVDSNGNFHVRIGLATSSNGNSFSKFAGAGTGSSDLDLSALGTAFDSREASGPSVVTPTGGAPFFGFYWGDRGSDFLPRLGQATSPDGSAWTKAPGAATGGSLIPLGGAGAFDAGGQRDPAAFYELNNAGDDYHVFFSALSGATPAVRSIGHTSSANVDDALNPVPSTWSDPAAATIAGDGSGFDANGASHPSVIKIGANYVMYYTGWSGTTPSIGCATSTTPTFAAVTRDACTVVAPTSGSFDANGVKDPVVWVAAPGDFRMTYTATEVLTDPGGDPRTIERIGYAKSTDGLAWTKQGPVFDPSQAPYAFDETRVEAAGAVLAGTTLHFFYNGIDRTGRARGGHASLDTTTGSGALANGWATYQVGDPTTTVRDWQQIQRTSTGPVTIWVSFLQPYSATGTEFWSDFFPVTESTPSEALSFLLTVRGVRWQVREDTGATAPSLDKLEIDSAPVQFTSAGSALTKEIGAPNGDQILQWRTVTVAGTTYAPNGGSASGTVKVLDAAGTTTLASATLNTSGDTTVDISPISATDHPTLRLEFDLAGGQASPLVQSAKVLYYTNVSPPPPAPPAPPPPPPAPPAPDLTLAANPVQVIFGQPVTLSGKLTQATAPLVSQSIQLLAGGKPFGTATTSATGDFGSSVTPQANTVYAASFPGASSTPSVTVGVHQRVTLKAARNGATATFKGAIAPAHPGRDVVIQLRKGTSFVAFAKARTTSTSGFSVKKKLKVCGKFQFRAVTAGDADHLDGTSLVALVEKHRVSLTVKVSGRKVTFLGKVSPLHRSGTVVIKELKGTKLVTVGKAKLTRKSVFKLVKKLAKGTHKLRADVGADRCHFGGSSPLRTAKLR